MSTRSSCSWGALSSSRCSGTLWPAAVAQAAARATGAACAPCRWPVPTAQPCSPSTTSVNPFSAKCRPCTLTLATTQRNARHLSHACNCRPPPATGCSLSHTPWRPESAPKASQHANRHAVSAPTAPLLAPHAAAAGAAGVRTGGRCTAAGGDSHGSGTCLLHPPASAPAGCQGVLAAYGSTPSGVRTASAVGQGSVSLWGCGPAPRRLAAQGSAVTHGPGRGARHGAGPLRALPAGGEGQGAGTPRLGPGGGSRVGGPRGHGRSTPGQQHQQHQQHAREQQPPGRRVVLPAADVTHGGERRAETVEEQIARCRWGGDARGVRVGGTRETRGNRLFVCHVGGTWRWKSCGGKGAMWAGTYLQSC